MEQNEFYSMVLKKKIKIPAADIKKELIKGKHFLVGKYTHNGKQYKAYKITKA
jgi:hypothetical protein